MLNLLKKKEEYFAVSPVAGTLKKLENVNDEVFSSMAMGNGFAVVPNGNEIYSPVSGVVEVVFPTKHAFGIKTKNGHEVIIHVGIDTVSLNGKGFNTHIQQGEKIRQGQHLVTIDDLLFEREDIDLTTMVVFPSYSELIVDISEKAVHEKAGIIK